MLPIAFFFFLFDKKYKLSIVFCVCVDVFVCLCVTQVTSGNYQHFGAVFAFVVQNNEKRRTHTRMHIYMCMVRLNFKQ